MTATPAGITYADYLRLISLGAQRPRSDLHDEMLFIASPTKDVAKNAYEVRWRRLWSRDCYAESTRPFSRVSRSIP